MYMFVLKSCVLAMFLLAIWIQCFYDGGARNRVHKQVSDRNANNKELSLKTVDYFFQSRTRRGLNWSDVRGDYRSPCWMEAIPHSFNPFQNRYWTFLYPDRVELNQSMTSLQKRMNHRISKGMTSRIRCLPAVFIGGMNKAGTTDLFDSLSRHPYLFPCMLKEPLWNLWQTGKMAPIDISDYIGLFDLAASQIEHFAVNSHNGISHPGLTLESTSVLLHMYRYWQQLPWNKNATEPRLFIADHFKIVNPNAKFIFLLREPVSWLESCYNYYYLNYQHFSPEDLHSRVTTDLENFHYCSAAGGSLNACVYNYNSDNCSVLNSLYYAPVRNWMNTFDRRQIFVGRAEDYYKNRQTVLSDIYNFLGIPQVIEHNVDKMAVKNKSRHKIPMLKKTKQIVSQFMHRWNLKLSELLGDPSFTNWYCL